MRHPVKRKHRKPDKCLSRATNVRRDTIDVPAAPCQRYKNLCILPGFYFYRPRHFAPVNATGFHVPASWHTPGKNWRVVWCALLSKAMHFVRRRESLGIRLTEISQVSWYSAHDAWQTCITRVRTRGNRARLRQSPRHREESCNALKWILLLSARARP